MPDRPRGPAPVARAAVLAALIVVVLGAPVGALARRVPSDQLAPYLLTSVGRGFTLSSHGPLDTEQVARFSEDPAATAQLLAHLSAKGDLLGYAKSWQSQGGLDTVADVLTSLPTVAAARALLAGEERSLVAAHCLTSSVPMIPGALHCIVLSAVPTSGVLQVVAFEVERYVGLVSLFSAVSSAHHHVFTSSEGALLATGQYHLLFSGPGVGTAPRSGRPAGGSSATGVVLVVIGTVALVALGLVLLRRRHRISVRIVEGEPDLAVSPRGPEPGATDR